MDFAVHCNSWRHMHLELHCPLSQLICIILFLLDYWLWLVVTHTGDFTAYEQLGSVLTRVQLPSVSLAPGSAPSGFHPLVAIFLHNCHFGFAHTPQFQGIQQLFWWIITIVKSLLCCTFFHPKIDFCYTTKVSLLHCYKLAITFKYIIFST